MQKEPSFTVKLSQLDRILLDSSPFYHIDLVRVSMHFSTLGDKELRDLEEYADASDGMIERWLLLPSSMPLSVLSFVIDRAFGLVPTPSSSCFLLPPDREKVYAPDFRSLLSRSGSLFFNPIDDEYLNKVASQCSVCSNFIMEAPYDLSHKSYEEVQEELDKLRADVSRFYDEPVTEDLLAEASFAAKEPFAHDLAPYLPYSYILGKEGSSLASAEQADAIFTKGRFNARARGAKPLSHELIYSKLSESEEGFGKGFIFSVTRPRDARSVFADGYIDLDGYIDAARYVSSSLLPDCIAKIGYDLFGETEEEYYSFIMRLHGPDNVFYRQMAELAGWREPFIDRKKVLR